MPTNYQTLITEVKKTKQNNIQMAPMFKGTPDKEPDQMSLLELLGAAYAILKEQDVSGDGNSAMKQWLSGVQVPLETIDSLPPAFPPESVFSAGLAAGGDKAMKKLMGDKASLQALGKLEERDRKIMSFFAVKVMGATLDLGVNKYVEGVMTADARMEAEERKKWDRFVEDSAYAETEQRKAKEDKAMREKYDLLMEENARKEMEMEAEERKKWDRFVEDSAYAETARRKAEEEKKARERREKEELERKRAENEAKLREERARQEAEDKATREKYDLLMEENARKEMEMEAEERKKWERFAEDSAYREAEQNAREKEKWDRFAEDSAYAETAANKKAEAEQEKRLAEQRARAENAARAAYERNEREDMERQAAALLREENLSASPDNMERRAALLRKENPSARPDKQMIIQESVQGDPGQRRYYDDALKAALQRAGLTEQELRTNNDARIHQSRSTEFYNVVHCAALARDTMRDDDVETLGGHMKYMVDYCIRYLEKYPKVRSTQSGRDSYELALNLLALSADPGDPKVRECIDKVNAARGAKPGTKNFIDLGDYGPDRLLGRKVPAGEYMKDVDKRIAEQLKHSKDKSLAPDDALKAKYEAIRLKMEKLYLKTAVTPSKAVYPDRIAEKTKELMFDRRLMDEMDTHQSEKEQERIMKDYISPPKQLSPEAQLAAQSEKAQNGPAAGK